MSLGWECIRLKQEDGFILYTEDIGWGDEIRFQDYHSASVFLNGCLHFVTMEPAVVAVDTEGKTWRTIRGWWQRG